MTYGTRDWAFFLFRQFFTSSDDVKSLYFRSRLYISERAMRSVYSATFIFRCFVHEREKEREIERKYRCFSLFSFPRCSNDPNEDPHEET